MLAQPKSGWRVSNRSGMEERGRTCNGVPGPLFEVLCGGFYDSVLLFTNKQGSDTLPLWGMKHLSRLRPCLVMRGVAARLEKTIGIEMEKAGSV